MNMEISIDLFDNRHFNDNQQNKENIGPAKTRNRGIAMSIGRYIAFLDGDDMWMPDFLSISVSHMRKHQYPFVFSSYKRLDEDLQPFLKDFIVPGKISYHGLLKTCPISCLTAVMDVWAIGKHYMPDIPKRQDYGLWLSVLKTIPYAYGIKQPLAIYRIRKNSLSRNKYHAMRYVWKVYREVENLNVLYSTYLIINYSFNGMIKYSR
ncbi:MAG: glycosyltransferase family 2 protein [Sphingobacteriaceae bacterium]|nr:MAG: glycosyltransferase family 2 protein [Sphingobacteriaceae bacterium]